MKSVEKKVDFNAHIADIQVSLIREEGKNYAQIACKNVSGKIITRISFWASGTDYFGDAIKTEDGTDFVITQNGLSLKPGESMEPCRLEINDEIRNLDLKEKEVEFADGACEAYAGAEEHIYHADCFMEDSYWDKPELDILKKIDVRFCSYPKETAVGWLCACAYLNRTDRSVCGGCGHNKNEVFLTCSKEAVAKQKQADQEAFEEKMRQMEAHRKKVDRIETAKFFAEVLLTLLLLFLAGYLFFHFRK